MSVRDEFDNGATYGRKILHTNLRRAWQGHGPGLISIGVFIGKKIYFRFDDVITVCDDVITMCGLYIGEARCFTVTMQALQRETAR